MAINYEKLYTDKCQQYREDMNLRNGQVNEGKLNIDNLHKVLENRDKTIGLLKAWYTKALFVASVAGLIFSLCYIGISSTASL